MKKLALPWSRDPKVDVRSMKYEAPRQGFYFCNLTSAF
jgi:hypothetical protein